MINDKLPDVDLQKVECENKKCNVIGEYGYCYADHFIDCPIYKSWKSFFDATSKG